MTQRTSPKTDSFFTEAVRHALIDLGIISTEESPMINKAARANSLMWQKGRPLLLVFFRLLKEYKLIPDEKDGGLTRDEFCSIFFDGSCRKSTRWMVNINMLALLFNELCEKGFTCKTQRKLNLKICTYFRDLNGDFIKSTTMRTERSKDNASKAGAEIISDLIAELENHSDE